MSNIFYWSLTDLNLKEGSYDMLCLKTFYAISSCYTIWKFAIFQLKFSVSIHPIMYSVCGSDNQQYHNNPVYNSLWALFFHTALSLWLAIFGQLPLVFSLSMSWNSSKYSSWRASIALILFCGLNASIFWNEINRVLGPVHMLNFFMCRI